MPKYILVFIFVFGSSAAFGMLPYHVATDGGVTAEPPRSDGTYHFYYHGTTNWAWNFPNGSYTAVNFDPTDNYGDITSDTYWVTYVDSLWNEEDEGPYYITVYICDDNGGVPDIDNPLYESDPYEPEYYFDQDEHEVIPPVQFPGGDICWVVFNVTSDGWPISDGDGNSGHSWISGDGYYWELFGDLYEVDWCVDLYAEPEAPPDDDPPYITDTYPQDEDWPSGVPPSENTSGCHWRDDYSGVDVGLSTFVIYDGDSNPVAGTLMVDDTDQLDVVVDFEADNPWAEGETYTVETTTFDNAGNTADEGWAFTTGYLNIDETSLGRVKAGFAE